MSAVVTAEILNIRRDPGFNAGVLFRLSRYDEVNVLDAVGDWLLVDIDRKSGWGYAQYLAEKNKRSLTIGFTLSQEGGYQNDPGDPGNWTGGLPGVGEQRGTNFGISASSYPKIDIASLSLREAISIYESDWYSRFSFEDWPMCVHRMDFAFHAGIATEELIYNRMLDRGPSMYPSLRKGFYSRLKNFPLYGDAWLSRVDRLEEFVQRLTPGR